MRIKHRHINDFTRDAAQRRVEIAEIGNRIDGDAGDRYLIIHAIARCRVDNDKTAGTARRVHDGRQIGLEDRIHQRRAHQVKSEPEIAQRITVVVGIEKVTVGKRMFGDGGARQREIDFRLNA